MTKLPDGWVTVPLEEIGSWGSGGTPKRTDSRFYSNGIIPWLVIGDLNDGVVTHAQTYITEEGLINSSAKLLPPNTLLFAMYGSIGKLGITGIECATNQAIAFCIPDQEIIELRYLFHALKYSKDELTAQGQGVAQKNISQTILRAHQIRVAPRKEQNLISNKLNGLLARVDACRDRLDRVPRLLNRFRQAVLAAAISGELTKDWRTEINRSLDSWQIKHGSDAFSFITSGSRGWAAYYTDRGAKFLRVGNLNHNTIDLDLRELQHVNPPSGAEGERTRIQVGDILISITADVGMVAFVGEDIGEAYINQHLCLARQTGEYSGAYLAYYLASPLGGLGQLTQMQRGVTKAGLTLRDIRSVKLLIPELDEQDEIVRRIESLFSYANLVEVRYHNALMQVERLIPLLLQKAFHGELVPQDPNDEPATILLERIRAEQLAKPKRVVVNRKPKMPKMTEESVKEVIRQLPTETLSFDELREKISGDYDLFKDILFILLSEAEPSLMQVFDQEAKAMRFVKGDK